MSSVTVKDELLFQARRAAVHNALTGTGMDPDLAEAWCDAWEVEATRQKIVRASGYWEMGVRWIAEQRAAEGTNRTDEGGWSVFVDDRGQRLQEQLRLEYIAGAEQEWLRRTGRSMTADELEGVVRLYPGDA